MLYGISLAIGLMLLIISLFLLKESLLFLKKSERATGTVIEVVQVDGNDGPTYKPVFKFKTLSDREIIYRHSSSSSPPSWAVGETATIAYDPNNPDAARLLTYFGVFSWTIVLMAIAMPMIVVGGGFYVSKFFLK